MRSADILPLYPNGIDYAGPFSAALLAPDSPAPTLVTGPRGKRAEIRYNVYRNNVTVSLIGALSSIFPATERITGPDFFRAMARFHVRETPPTSPLLFEYGRAFPDFIDRYEHAAGMPWLSDVARIERLWLDSYHAADAPTLKAEMLSSVPPERLGALVFVPHPATRLISSVHPAITVFAMNRSAAPVGRVEDRPEDGLITRVDDEVTVRLLPPGNLVFLKALIAGYPLATAAGAAFAAEPAFDLSDAIGGMIAAGAFSHAEMETSNVEPA
ncbi:DNA-binding domain-containing protein [Pleomorphomonas sp. NRK KF1]|uniref:HvfC/BufC N-terminal domain-containing protein n=1 Tax=Pleomorphomonas sp. NRK KF1 TaxID=2943000 RepID=UPI00204316E3|nr:DNA-binding domain-containing protein [Pleomorphomonas sp. NRK KF1]MCM5555618.1 DNA-binding domain-containing protein [Pleomorphomonas sp. NRK KF1]